MELKIGDLDISNCFKTKDNTVYINVIDICTIFYNHRTSMNYNDLTDVSKSLFEDLFVFSQVVVKNLESNFNIPVITLKQDQPDDALILNEQDIVLFETQIDGISLIYTSRLRE